MRLSGDAVRFPSALWQIDLGRAIQREPLTKTKELAEAGEINISEGGGEDQLIY